MINALRALTVAVSCAGHRTNCGAAKRTSRRQLDCLVRTRFLHDARSAIQWLVNVEQSLMPVLRPAQGQYSENEGALRLPKPQAPTQDVFPKPPTPATHYNPGSLPPLTKSTTSAPNEGQTCRRHELRCAMTMPLQHHADHYVSAPGSVLLRFLWRAIDLNPADD